MVSILYAEKFIAQFESLPKNIQILAEKKINLFIQNTRHGSLGTHKLNGKLSGFFSFSVNNNYRIVFEYGERNTVYFLKIGNHEVYR